MDHRKLRRNPSHRKALMRNLMNALVRSERIVTTVAKAKELRRLADRLITLGKRADTHARRTAFAMLSDKENTEKIFAGLAGRFVNRQGGYTRIVRTGFRAGDGSDMAILEYLPSEEKKAGAAKGKKKGGGKKAGGGREADARGRAGRKSPDKENAAGEKPSGRKPSKGGVSEKGAGPKAARKTSGDKTGSAVKKGVAKKTTRKGPASKTD